MELSLIKIISALVSLLFSVSYRQEAKMLQGRI